MAKHQAKGPAAKSGLQDVQKVADRRRVQQVTNPFRTLLDILRRLDEARIAYRVTRYRYDAISVIAKVPGERWEIDVLEDGDVDFERFVSDGQVSGEEELTQFITRWAEPAEEAAK